jgi:hypothetical protein
MIVSEPKPDVFMVNGEGSYELLERRMREGTLVYKANVLNRNLLEEASKFDWNFHPETKIISFPRGHIGYSGKCVPQATVAQALLNKNVNFCSLYLALRTFFRLEKEANPKREYRVIIQPEAKVGDIEHVRFEFGEVPIITVYVRRDHPGRTYYLGEDLIVVDSEQQICPHGA